MPFAFETHVLPVLRDMAADPLAEDYPLRRRLQELGCADDVHQADRLIDLMKADSYVTFIGSQNGAGAWLVLADVRLTPKALKQLDLWPADDERGLYLMHRIADALDAVADDAEADEEPGRSGVIRTAAQVIRETGVELTAKVISNVITGGS